MIKLAVLGNPIEHSKSPFIHQHFAQYSNIDILYEKILVPLDSFESQIKKLITENYKGINITVPFKEQAYALSNSLSKRAEIAHAVNTFLFDEQNGSIHGDNTDGLGIMWDFHRLSWDLKDRKVLIIGAGGASKGILGPIIDAHPSQIVIVNRTLSKAIEIKNLYPQSKVDTYTYQQLKDLDIKFDLIINATSLSLNNALPDIMPTIFHCDSFCYDLMYTPKETTIFLDWCKNHKVKCCSDGLGMLVGQAAKSFELWTGVQPDGAKVLNDLRSYISHE